MLCFSCSLPIFVLLFGCISRIVFNYECEWFTHVLVVVALVVVDVAVVVVVVVVVHVAAAVGLCQGCALFFPGQRYKTNYRNSSM